MIPQILPGPSQKIENQSNVVPKQQIQTQQNYIEDDNELQKLSQQLQYKISNVRQAKVVMAQRLNNLYQMAQLKRMQEEPPNIYQPVKINPQSLKSSVTLEQIEQQSQQAHKQYGVKVLQQDSNKKRDFSKTQMQMENDTELVIDSVQNNKRQKGSADASQMGLSMNQQRLEASMNSLSQTGATHKAALQGNFPQGLNINPSLYRNQNPLGFANQEQYQQLYGQPSFGLPMAGPNYFPGHPQHILHPSQPQQNLLTPSYSPYLLPGQYHPAAHHHPSLGPQLLNQQQYLGPPLFAAHQQTPLQINNVQVPLQHPHQQTNAQALGALRYNRNASLLNQGGFDKLNQVGMGLNLMQPVQPIQNLSNGERQINQQNTANFSQNAFTQLKKDKKPQSNTGINLSNLQMIDSKTSNLKIQIPIAIKQQENQEQQDEDEQQIINEEEEQIQSEEDEINEMQIEQKINNEKEQIQPNQTPNQNVQQNQQINESVEKQSNNQSNIQNLINQQENNHSIHEVKIGCFKIIHDQNCQNCSEITEADDKNTEGVSNLPLSQRSQATELKHALNFILGAILNAEPEVRETILSKCLQNIKNENLDDKSIQMLQIAQEPLSNLFKDETYPESSFINEQNQIKTMQVEKEIQTEISQNKFTEYVEQIQEQIQKDMIQQNDNKQQLEAEQNEADMILSDKNDQQPVQLIEELTHDEFKASILSNQQEQINNQQSSMDKKYIKTILAKMNFYTQLHEDAKIVIKSIFQAQETLKTKFIKQQSEYSSEEEMDIQSERSLGEESYPPKQMKKKMKNAEIQDEFNKNQYADKITICNLLELKELMQNILGENFNIKCEADNQFSPTDFNELNYGDIEVLLEKWKTVLLQTRNTIQEKIQGMQSRIMRKIELIYLRMILQIQQKKFKILIQSFSKKLKSSQQILQNVVHDIKDPWNLLTYNRRETILEIDKFIKNKYQLTNNINCFVEEDDTDQLIQNSVQGFMIQDNLILEQSNYINEQLKLKNIDQMNCLNKLMQNFKPQEDIIAMFKENSGNSSDSILNQSPSDLFKIDQTKYVRVQKLIELQNKESHKTELYKQIKTPNPYQSDCSPCENMEQLSDDMPMDIQNEENFENISNHSQQLSLNNYQDNKQLNKKIGNTTEHQKFLDMLQQKQKSQKDQFSNSNYKEQKQSDYDAKVEKQQKKIMITYINAANNDIQNNINQQMQTQLTKEKNEDQEANDKRQMIKKIVKAAPLPHPIFQVQNWSKTLHMTPVKNYDSDDNVSIISAKTTLAQNMLIDLAAIYDPEHIFKFNQAICEDQQRYKLQQQMEMENQSSELYQSHTDQEQTLNNQSINEIKSQKQTTIMNPKLQNSNQQKKRLQRMLQAQREQGLTQIMDRNNPENNQEMTNNKKLHLPAFDFNPNRLQQQNKVFMTDRSEQSKVSKSKQSQHQSHQQSHQSNDRIQSTQQ